MRVYGAKFEGFPSTNECIGLSMEFDEQIQALDRELPLYLAILDYIS